MPLQTFQVADYGARKYSPGPDETYLNGGAAWYCVYRTRDGRHVALGAAEEKFWRRFCEAAQHREWIEREAKPMPQHALIGEVQALFAGLTLAECIARFDPADCCFSPVLTLAEALQSDQCLERELVRRASDGALQLSFRLGRWRTAGDPSDTAYRRRRIRGQRRRRGRRARQCRRPYRSLTPPMKTGLSKVKVEVCCGGDPGLGESGAGPGIESGATLGPFRSVLPPLWLSSSTVGSASLAPAAKPSLTIHGRKARRESSSKMGEGAATSERLQVVEIVMPPARFERATQGLGRRAPRPRRRRARARPGGIVGLQHRGLGARRHAPGGTCGL